MTDLALNNPVVRQNLLRQRLEAGDPLIAAELAKEFDISLDTIRRDLLVLESEGLVQRVRGGAVPVRADSSTYSQRRQAPAYDCQDLVAASLPLIREGMTLMLDGGTTLTHLAERLPALRDLFVITPSPTVASVLLQKDIATHLIGGRISRWGGMAVGTDAERMLSNLTADLCFLGVCSLDAAFGLSAYDGDEASLKRAMADASGAVALICPEDKMGQRDRHRVLPTNRISILVSDADTAMVAPFTAAGVQTVHV